MAAHLGVVFLRSASPNAFFNTRSCSVIPLSRRIAQSAVSTRTSFPRSRHSVRASSSLVHEVELLASIQPHSETYSFIFPFLLILVPVFFAQVLDWERLITSIRSRVSFLRSSYHWQGIQRQFAQISTVLILANAFHSNIVAPDPNDTYENVPQDLSGADIRKRIQKPKSQKAERCTQKCVGTCIRGSEGPFNVRKPLVVFKEGFRTRQYCLIECSDICNLIGDADDGP